MKTAFLLVAVLLVGGFLAYGRLNPRPDQPTRPAAAVPPSTSSTDSPTPTPTISSAAAGIFPISNPETRITKKPFGLHVTPKDSPVPNERFSGYHTGLDFETTKEEQDADVPVFAICDGKLLQKRTASGYGGVAVQSCTINGQAVTVVYGHLKLSSVTAKTGTELQTGTQIGILGKGFSAETDGERKHLHLGIHKGTAISILGYVSTQQALDGWMDPAAVLGLK